MWSTPRMEKRLYSRADSAIYLDKSTREIDRMIRSLTIIAKKDGRRTVIEKRELDRYADRLPVHEPKWAQEPPAHSTATADLDASATRRRLFSRDQAAEYLSVPRSEIDRLIRGGRVLAKVDGRRTVIDQKELDRLAD